MADAKDKPSLAVVIAQAKEKGKKPAPMEGAGEPDADDEDYGDDEASPEVESCVKNMFEAGADGDYASAAKALIAALKHAE